MNDAIILSCSFIMVVGPDVVVVVRECRDDVLVQLCNNKQRNNTRLVREGRRKLQEGHVVVYL